MSAWDDQLRKAMEQAGSNPPRPFAGLTDEEAAAQDVDRFPKSMIEMTTEYDWEDLPDWLQDVMRHAANEIRRWDEMQESPIQGELADETPQLAP